MYRLYGTASGLKVAGLLTALALVSACSDEALQGAIEPAEPESYSNDLCNDCPEGAGGLLSGDDGVLTVLGDDREILTGDGNAPVDPSRPGRQYRPVAGSTYVAPPETVTETTITLDESVTLSPFQQ